MTPDAGREPSLPAREAVPPREPQAPYYAFRAAEAVARLLPRRVGYWLACRVADVVAVARPAALDGLRANLRHVLPDADERRLRRIARENLRNLARGWVDVMLMRHRRRQMLRRLSYESFEHYGNARAAGRPTVVVSLHLGSWEEGLATWNTKSADGLALLAEKLRPQRLFDRVAGARGALGVKVIPIDVETMRESDPATARRIGAAAMREVVRLLRSGGAVAIAMDRDLIGNGRPMRFFDAEAPIPVGVVEVAIRTGAAVIPVTLFRTPRGPHGIVHPEIPYDPALPRDTEVARVCAEVLRIFEVAIRKHPEQWQVLDPIWPETAAAERIA